MDLFKKIILKFLFFLVLTTSAFGKDLGVSAFTSFNLGAINCSLSCFFNLTPPMAQLKITGEPFATIYLNLPATISLQFNTNTIVLNNFIYPSSINLDSNGDAVVNITGNIMVSPQTSSNIIAGSYSGYFDASISTDDGSQASSTIIISNLTVNFITSASVLQSLSFGKIIIPSTKGINCTVTVSTNNSISYNGCISVDSSTNPAIATLQMSLADGSTPTISVNPAEYLYGPSSQSIIVNNITTSLETFDNFNYTIKVGGTLNIPSGTSTGLYSGTITITINY
jgi:hypothetical protein